MATQTVSPTQGVSEAAIASVFLKEIGAPDTEIMRKAVTAWLRRESGSKVIGNNPWNIKTSAAKGLGIEPVGSRKHSRTGAEFAVYGSMADGTKAAARLLLRGAAKGDWRNYQAVIGGARTGDPVAFLNGLASSAWSEDRYGGTSNNRLLGDFKRITGLRNVQGAPPAVTGSAGKLGAFGNLVSFPVGHIVTQADVDMMMDRLEKAGFFKDYALGALPGDQAPQEFTRKILSSAIGKPWDKALQDDLQKQFFSAADDAADLPDMLKPFASVFDPGFWARILALIAGTALVGFGVIRLAKV